MLENLLRELKEELLGKEMDLWELDNSMIEFNFASCENSDMDEAKECGNLAFPHKELEDEATHNAQWVLVEFEVLDTELTNDTDTDNFDLRITSIGIL